MRRFWSVARDQVEKLMEPSYQATLGYTAKKTIRADIAWTQEHIGHAETGGWLFASPRNPNYICWRRFPGPTLLSAATRSASGTSRWKPYNAYTQTSSLSATGIFIQAAATSRLMQTCVRACTGRSSPADAGTA